MHVMILPKLNDTFLQKLIDRAQGGRVETVPCLVRREALNQRHGTRSMEKATLE